jgi:glucose-1-phosphate cytidylyltransferase
MKLVIFAGGLGSRLSEETKLRPKPMVQIGNKPILWHIMKIYSFYKIKDFIICGGYKYEQILNYFKKNHKNVLKEGWNVKVINTGLKTMTGGRLKKVSKLLNDKEDFCLTYGDGLCNVNISRLIKFHKKHKKMATVLAVNPPARFGSLLLKKNIVKKFEEKILISNDWINGGFFVLSKKVIKFIRGDKTVWENEPLKNIAKKKQLVAFKHRSFWSPMDTLREKIVLSKMWRENKAPWKIWEND